MLLYNGYSVPDGMTDLMSIPPEKFYELGELESKGLIGPEFLVWGAEPYQHAAEGQDLYDDLDSLDPL